MWVHINKDGKVTTVLSHGNIIRQGSSFDVFVAIEKEYFRKFIGKEFPLYSTERICDWANSNLSATFTFDNSSVERWCEPERLYFEKLKENENTSSFYDKQYYVGYVFKGTTTDSEKYGTFNLVLRLVKTENEVDVIGPIQLNIEKTYGDKTIVTGVTREQIDEIRRYIDKKTSGSGVMMITQEFNSYEEFVKYCLTTLQNERQVGIACGIVHGEITFAIISNGESNGVTLITAKGNLYNYKYNKFSDSVYYDEIKMDALDLYEYLQMQKYKIFRNQSGDLEINYDDDSSSIIDLSFTQKSTGILIGDQYLEEYTIEKHAESMPHIGDEAPNLEEFKLKQVWFDTSGLETIVPQTGNALVTETKMASYEKVLNQTYENEKLI